jgi:hypothetical protein
LKKVLRSFVSGFRESKSGARKWSFSPIVDDWDVEFV